MLLQRTASPLLLVELSMQPVPPVWTELPHINLLVEGLGSDERVYTSLLGGQFSDIIYRTISQVHVSV